MNIEAELSQPMPLSAFVANPDALPEESWLYARELSDLSPSSMCSFTIRPSRELSDEEADERDSLLESLGYRCVLCRAQIEDILENLKLQRARPTSKEIEEAVVYFIKNDAFIQK